MSATSLATTNDRGATEVYAKTPPAMEVVVRLVLGDEEVKVALQVEWPDDDYPRVDVLWARQRPNLQGPDSQAVDLAIVTGQPGPGAPIPKKTPPRGNPVYGSSEWMPVAAIAVGPMVTAIHNHNIVRIKGYWA